MDIRVDTSNLTKEQVDQIKLKNMELLYKSIGLKILTSDRESRNGTIKWFDTINLKHNPNIKVYYTFNTKTGYIRRIIKHTNIKYRRNWTQYFMLKSKDKHYKQYGKYLKEGTPLYKMMESILKDILMNRIYDIRNVYWKDINNYKDIFNQQELNKRASIYYC